MRAFTPIEILRVVGSIKGLSPTVFLPGVHGRGGTWLDRSGNAAHGTLTAVTWKHSPRGKMYPYFNGATSVITVTDKAAIQDIFNSPGGTLLAFIRPDSDGEGNFGRIWSKGEAVAKGNNLFLRDEAAGFVKLCFTSYYAVAGEWKTTSAVIPISKWSLVAVTYDNSATTKNPIFYLNGSSQAVTESVTPVGVYASDAGVNLLIGNLPAGSNTFDGGIDLVIAIKGTILTAAQILTIYNRLKHLYGFA